MAIRKDLYNPFWQNAPDYSVPGAGVPPSEGKQYQDKKFFRILLKSVVQSEVNPQYKNTQTAFAPLVPNIIKEVNIDLDYAKNSIDYLKYKVFLKLPRKVATSFDFLYGCKGFVINPDGKVFRPYTRKIIRFDLLNNGIKTKTKYKNSNLKSMIQKIYGSDWDIVREPTVLSATTTITIWDWLNWQPYAEKLDDLDTKFRELIDWNSLIWTETNEAFDGYFKMQVIKEEKVYNAPDGVKKTSIERRHNDGTPGGYRRNEGYPKWTIKINCIELWIEKQADADWNEYPEPTRILYQNNFLLNNHTWKKFASSFEFEDININCKVNEKIVIHGLFLPEFCEINNTPLFLPSIPNLGQITIKHIK
ncbi:hypothetical protein LLZ86_03010 [Metamycoplasma hominis]|uniref:hypothetical protein n=1 Tax=Metamycoplasma hominis TaxID=2098 RepID=UPI001F1B5541|nr:hypothetical protein [Metamycoplasma hominis]UIU37729.1 hypothetical protein LLZ86_03010 [Metamycoplasma hominis]